MHPALEFSHVTRRWRAGILGSAAESIAIDDCSLAVAPGEIVVVTPQGNSRFVVAGRLTVH